MASMDIVSWLPSEISLRILAKIYSAKQLSICTGVNKAWRNLANDDILWRELCRIRWEGKKHISFELHPRVDYSSLTSTLTMKEIKAILKLRNVDFKDLLEKQEFVSKLKSSLPKESPNGRWSGKWKASYIVAEIDSHRKLITKAELCSITWKMNFLQQWDTEEYTSTSRFFPDYTYISDLYMMEQPMHWRFYDKKIQVNQYPSLTIGRTEDWGWTLTNSHVILHSVDPRFDEEEEAKKRKKTTAEFAKRYRNHPSYFYEEVDDEEDIQEHYQQHHEHHFNNHNQHHHNQHHQADTGNTHTTTTTTTTVNGVTIDTTTTQESSFSI